MKCERLKISDFSQVITGGTPSTSKKEYWENGSIPWLNSGELNQNIIETCENKITELGLQNSSSRIMPPDTVLIALTGTTTGVVGYLTFEACANQSVTGILPSSKHHPKYLYYYLKSIRSKILEESYGGAQKHISQGYVKELEIPLPPLETQKRIADILNAADALRQKDQELLKKYDELAQAIFIDMFGDPVSNPKGWDMRIMENVCENICVGFVGICEPFYTDVENGIPMIRTGNLGEGFLRFDKMKYVTKEFHLKQKKSQLFKDDILIARHGDNGKAVLYNGEFNEANCLNIIILRPAKGQLNGTYNVNMLNIESTRNLILGKTGGATQKVVNTKEIQKLILPIPPIELQNQFAERVAAVLQQKAIAQENLYRSEALFNNLLHETFKGELI